VRRDLNSLMSLAGRHLVWPEPVLRRLREFLGRRCKDNDSGAATSSWAREFLERHGTWRGPYEEGTLFFYLDEYAKDRPRTCWRCWPAPAQWLTHALKKQSTLVEKNIDALAGLLQLNKAERALLLYGTLARYQRDLRSILVEFKVNNAPEAYAAIAELAGVNASRSGRGAARRLAAGAHRPGREPDLRAQHHRPGRPDEGQRKAAAGADARIPRPGRADGRVHPPASKSALKRWRLRLCGDDTQVLCAPAAQCRWRARSRASTCCCTARPAPARPSWPRWWRRRPGWTVRGGIRRPRRQLLSGRDRYRSLQIAQVFLKGSAQAALLFDEVEDVFPPISSEAAS
jgi:hypothetical protein